MLLKKRGHQFGKRVERAIWGMVGRRKRERDFIIIL